MYLTRKYHLGTLFFTFRTGDAAAILHDHPSYAKQCNRLQCEGSTLVFKGPGNRTRDLRSAVKRSTD